MMEDLLQMKNWVTDGSDEYASFGCLESQEKMHSEQGGELDDNIGLPDGAFIPWLVD